MLTTRLATSAAAVTAAAALWNSSNQPLPSCSSNATHKKLVALDDQLRKVEGNLHRTSREGSPLFTFGVIADIQHADIDDATNFSGCEFRGYRRALEVAKKAIEFWNTHAGISFVAQLGDLIDGQNAGKYGQGLKFKEPQSDVALERVMAALKLDNSAPFVNAIGNHELYNFSPSDLRRHLGMPHDQLSSGTAQDDPSTRPLHYTFSPHPGWRIVMLNGYEVSTELPAGSKGRIEAEKVIRQNHPHAEAVLNGQGSVNFFEGLTGMGSRFVPFNGGFGREQLEWFRETLEAARWSGERVIVLTHMPIHPMACGRQAHDDPASAKNLPYDGPEAHRIIWEHGRGCVVAILAGHAHGGGHYTG